MVCVFFFKQKTAYEIQYGLVGSEMCIRDRSSEGEEGEEGDESSEGEEGEEGDESSEGEEGSSCLLYTSDAADERSSVDLGGRRIIKKKNKKETGESKTRKTLQQRNIRTNIATKEHTT